MMVPLRSFPFAACDLESPAFHLNMPQLTCTHQGKLAPRPSSPRKQQHNRTKHMEQAKSFLSGSKNSCE